MSSTDLWLTCGPRSRKHSNLQTPGEGQQQSPVNQVNLNTNSSSALPQHGQQKQSAAGGRGDHPPSLLSFLPSLPRIHPSLISFFLPFLLHSFLPSYHSYFLSFPTPSFAPPSFSSFLLSFLSSQSSVGCCALPPSGRRNLPIEEKSCRQRRQVFNASPMNWTPQARSAVSLCPSVHKPVRP